MVIDQIQLDFERFHEENPEVYNLFVKTARHLKSNGYKRVGLKLIWELVRWSEDFRTLKKTGPVTFKDKFQSRYARLAQKREKDLEGFYETRPFLSEIGKKQVVTGA